MKFSTLLKPLVRPPLRAPTMRHLGVDGTVRASVHYYNLEEEIEKFIGVLGQIAREFGG